MASSTPIKPTFESCDIAIKFRQECIDNELFDDIPHLNESIAHMQEELLGIPYEETLKLLDIPLNNQFK